MGVALFLSVALVLSFLMWVKEKWILPILIFIVPLQRYSIYIEPLRFSLKLVVILLPVALLILFVKQRSKFHFDRKLFAVFALVVLGEVLSLLGSINVFRTISVIAFTIMTGAFAYLISVLIRSKENFVDALRYLVISGSYVSFIGIWQFIRYLQEKSVVLPFEGLLLGKTITAGSFVYDVGESSFLRPSSTFIDVNLAAGFLAVVVLVCFALLVHFVNLRKTKYAIAYLSAMILNIVAFSLTVSRSAYLGLSVAVIFFILLNWRTVLNRQILSLIGVLVIVASGAVYVLDTPIDAMLARVRTTFFEHDPTGSTEEHVAFSSAAWEMYKEFPLIGVGGGNFEEYYLSKVDAGEDTAYTYNIYLGFLSETGILGLITQLSFIGFVLVRALKRIFNNVEGRLLYAAVLCGLFAILVANLFYAYYILFFVWLVIGLVIAGFNIEIDKKENAKQTD